jgi:2-polyprenyl-3-methyl-5-hydroxy-6-metoxy-1,4-benzoquinol methylase
MPDRKAPGWRWQDDAAKSDMFDEKHLGRRSALGFHDVRLDGIGDLLHRARGASVLDIGMNRGHVAYEFYLHGARIIHGCDIFAPGVQVARHWFAELEHVESKFEVIDLTEANALISAFGKEKYDIVLFIGVYHKLIRVMKSDALSALVQQIGNLTQHYLGYNGFTEHLAALDIDLAAVGLERIHTSSLLSLGRPSAIWARR